MKNKFLTWLFPPPKPEVSVTLVRRTEDGGTVTCNLEGEEASKWGYYIMDTALRSEARNGQKFRNLKWNKQFTPPKK